MARAVAPPAVELASNTPLISTANTNCSNAMPKCAADPSSQPATGFICGPICASAPWRFCEASSQNA